MIRRYSELQQIKTFTERYEYLRLGGVVGRSTFGFDRYLNQRLYTSRRWRRTRDSLIIRDEGCDLGMLDYEINSVIIVHHMNTVTLEQLESLDDSIFDPEFLICTSHSTHNAIHYGDDSLLPRLPIVRSRGDTTPWI